MFGLLKTLVYVLIIILIGCSIFFWSYRVPITSYGLSHLLNNPTTLQEVDLSISLARINGKNIAIENPPISNKKIKDAVRARSIEVTLKLSSFFSRPVVIEELYLDHVYFFIDIYNVTGSASNWKTVIYNMNAPAKLKREEGLNPRGVIIKKLVIENLIFTYRHPTLTAGSYRTLKPIPKLVLYDIGKGHPVTAAQLATLISQVMIRQFATMTGITDIIRGLPLLPFEFLKNIFIRKGHHKTSLDVYFQLPKQEPVEPPGFFKKMFSFLKKPSPKTV
jgi:hypothetical protein